MAQSIENLDFTKGFPLDRDESNQEGTFWSYTTEKMLPAGFYQYKYMVQFADGSTRIVSDPCTRYGGSENQDAAFVVGGSRPGDNIVQPLKSGRKHLRDLIIYEMNIDDFTNEYLGLKVPLDAVTDKLDYLVNMGFNAILFMPWTVWKYRDFDWGYEPFQYFAIEYRYANDLEHPAEKISWLKKLVNAYHERDITLSWAGCSTTLVWTFPTKSYIATPQSALTLATSVASSPVCRIGTSTTSALKSSYGTCASTG